MPGEGKVPAGVEEQECLAEALHDALPTSGQDVIRCQVSDTAFFTVKVFCAFLFKRLLTQLCPSWYVARKTANFRDLHVHRRSQEHGNTKKVRTVFCVVSASTIYWCAV